MPTAAAPLHLFQTSPECCGGHDPCVCLREERVLRAYLGSYGDLPPMTSTEREWCLEEIDSVEGYSRSDYENASDSDLANGVLSAWLTFCRDTGLM